MNQKRRKEIRAIIDGLAKIKVSEFSEEENADIADKLNDLCADVYSIMADEEEYMENIPENMQGGSRYEAAEEACDNLQNAIDEIDDAAYNVDDKGEMIKNIEGAIKYLSNAM